MAYGIRKGLEDIAYELKGIKNILGAMWSSRYKNNDTDQVGPEAYADEYISTDECAQRLNVSDQTIRNWILIGKKDPSKGWTQNIHYVNISPDTKKKDTIRIPWNRLVASFAKNNEVSILSFRARTKYRDVQEDKQKHVPDRSVPKGENDE